MALKTIVVHQDADPRSKVRLRIAATLAKAHEGLLSAVYTPRPIYVPGQIVAQLGDMVLRDLESRQHEEIIAAREAILADAAAAYGFAAVQFHSEGGDPIEGLARHVMAADLVVVGQKGPGGASDGVPADFAESLAEATGRPVLCVPRDGDLPAPGKRIVVAWKASAQAARATAFALPLLQRAESVTVLSMVDRDGADNGPDGAAALARALQRQGVSASAEIVTLHGASAPDGLLAAVRRLDADLLVAGCYSHSRLRERLLGGVTRTLLLSMPVPTLFAA